MFADKIKEILKPKVNVIKPNMIYLNEHITAYADKYVLSKRDDFSIAQQFLKRNSQNLFE